jgi:hypothetical protein
LKNAFTHCDALERVLRRKVQARPQERVSAIQLVVSGTKETANT